MSVIDLNVLNMNDEGMIKHKLSKLIEMTNY